MCFYTPLPAVHELAPRQWRHASLDYQVSTLCATDAGSRERHTFRSLPNNAEVRAFVAGLPAEERDGLANEEAMDRAKERHERLRDQHARTIPITAQLVALILVSLSDLTQAVITLYNAPEYPTTAIPSAKSASSSPDALYPSLCRHTVDLRFVRGLDEVVVH